MRTWGALVLGMATASLATAENVLSDLFYTTTTPCAALRALPTQQDLHSQLLVTDESFHGSITLSKSDTTTGCALHVAVRGDLNTHDAFALTRQVDASFATLLATQGLRGADAPQDLTLKRLRIKVANRDYAMDTNAKGEEATGDLTLNGDGCDDFASKELLNNLLGDGIGDVAVVPGQVDVANCAIGLDIMGRVPTFGSTNDAVTFLQAADATLDKWFGPTATQQSTATLRSARLAFSPPKSAMFAAAELGTENRVNAPTKQITMGILMGLMLLTTMLVGIVYHKKRHEQSLQQRHDNASRAAQIRRVSYRMGYEPVRTKDTDEEQKNGLL